MSRKPGALRDRLLAGVTPPGQRLEAYRSEVRAMIEQKEQRLARQRFVSSAMWLFLVVLCTVFLFLALHQVTGADYLTAFDPAQLDAQAMSYLDGFATQVTHCDPQAPSRGRPA